MKYKDALIFLKELLKTRPKYIVGGSMGLILQGAISPRFVNDFDFVAIVPWLDLGDECACDEVALNCELDFEYTQSLEKDYRCYKVNSDIKAVNKSGGYFYYNIFLRNSVNSKDIVVDGYTFTVQHYDEIFKYKAEWSRSKDLIDIKGRLK